MSETIFNINDYHFANGNIFSFSDCPNKCVNGKYFDYVNHEKKICLHCKNKREELVKNNKKLIDSDVETNISNILRLPDYLNGINFDVNSIILPEVLDEWTEESITKSYEEINNIIKDASIGIIPEYSIMINLGYKIRIANLIYPLMMRYYISGVNISPSLNSRDIEILRYGNDIDKDNLIKEIGVSFDDLIKKDLCVIFIDAGANETVLGILKGLMELRSFSKRPTIFLTGHFSKSLFNLTTDEKLYNLAHFITVNRKESKTIKQKKKSNTNGLDRGQELTAEEFNNLFK